MGHRTQMNRTLEHKRIILAVTGSIAAVETIKLAHELRRRGAAVTGILTPAACGIIHPDALTYACAEPALTKITGMVEHVLYCGEGGRADLLLIAPATANTIGKIACGIDDTIVTTFATTAIGRGMPVVLVPAMHESMYRHPAVIKNLETIRSMNITVVPPRMEEEKAKIAGIDEICLYAERALSAQPLSGRRVLITSGSCREELDDVRILTTRSSGTMGRALALEAFRLGADVTVVSNTAVHGAVPCVRNISISSAADMHDTVLREVEEHAPDIYLSAAAISDFAPERTSGKIPSGSPCTISLHPLPKLITRLFGKGIKIVAFKLGENAETEAEKLLQEDDIVLVAANRPAVMGADAGVYLLMKKSGSRTISGTKSEIARELWNELL
ncbi:MAG: bifunctional phosphopantothenoylcysteine decarboxylase/phosphopantothenate--cysteine ligase CoaBC [Methanocorpusculum sp.]|nr:bifunctional phosphopantothenoylcysteine decarboxylase/phosphopantothenate--cysteine ligase CoaBC [Methanocorpusculum sp.]MDE2523895.1 bifunctional phosphopantothenoylcysteine decarboxylase/phosphopantothenate--cysteine ligase CoaBC [Methanocorpusculum sp.]